MTMRSLEFRKFIAMSSNISKNFLISFKALFVYRKCGILRRTKNPFSQHEEQTLMNFLCGIGNDHRLPPFIMCKAIRSLFYILDMMILYRWYAIARVAFGCWKIEKHWDEPICQKTMTREDQKKSWGKFKTLILNLIWNSNFLYYVVYKIDRSCFELRHIWYSTHLDNFATFKCFSIMKTNVR